MANLVGRLGMKVVTIVVGIPVGMVTKKAVEHTWATARPEDPPRKPSQAGVQWADAVSWAALSAVGVVVADLLTRRAAETTWRVLLGTPPPAPKAGKAQKAQKRLESAQRKADLSG